jgi:1,4-dihydroxy-2-naphthoate octaprenyltransferase
MGLIAIAYVYMIGLVLAGVLTPWTLLVLLSLPKAVSLSAGFTRNVPEAADANTAQLNTIFGLLLIAALIVDKLITT